MDNQRSRIIDINVGGYSYVTTLTTLTRDPSTLLGQYFNTISLSGNPQNLQSQGSSTIGAQSNSPSPATTSASSPQQQGQSATNDVLTAIQSRADGTYFIDRDGEMFRYLLDYLRTGKLLLPDNFQETSRLREEAKFYKMNEVLKLIKGGGANNRRGTAQGAILPSLVNGTPPSYAASGADASNVNSGYVTVGYRGTFAFGRDGQADVKFRKLSRIIVCGRANLCREVFGDTLNESRDPDRGGENRYTARLYLKHSSLELAFDMLADHGFELITSCASGTCASGDLMRGNAADSEEQKWNHYNEFVFYRPTQ